MLSTSAGTTLNGVRARVIIEEYPADSAFVLVRFLVEPEPAEPIPHVIVRKPPSIEERLRAAGND